MRSHFSQSRDLNYDDSDSWLAESTKKDWRCKSCWLHPWECGPEVVLGLGGVTTSPTLFGPFLAWCQRSYERLLKTMRYFETHRVAVPRPSLEENRVLKKCMSVFSETLRCTAIPMVTNCSATDTCNAAVRPVVLNKGVRKAFSRVPLKPEYLKFYSGFLDHIESR